MNIFSEVMPPLASLRVGGDLVVAVHSQVSSTGTHRTVVSAFDTDGNAIRQLGVFSEDGAHLLQAALPALIGAAIESCPHNTQGDWICHLDEHLASSISFGSHEQN